MMTEMDAGIGRVLKALDERGLRENTLVIFHSDNGGIAKNGLGSNGNLRAGKGTVYEGGVRVCAWMRWPARWKKARRCDALMGNVDLLPTLAGIAQAEAPSALDGIDVLPFLDGAEKPGDRMFYIDGDVASDGDAVITQRWKLIGERLFDLDQDVGETLDAAEAHPEIAAKLSAEMKRLNAMKGAPYIPPGLPEKKTKAMRQWEMPECGPSMGEP
jgi:arylsulfatase B